MLEALGLSAVEEQVYRLLVGHHSGETRAIAAELGIPASAMEPIVQGLLEKRLITRAAGLLAPTPPDVSLSPLVAQGQAELEQARAAVARLAEQYRNGARLRDSTQLVQVVTGAETIREHALSLQRRAREEMLWFCRGDPIAMTESENDEESRALERGVRYRVLYETALLEEPGALAGLVDDIRAGEDARSVPTLPIRLAIADRSLALCPLPADDAVGEPTAALVFGSSLLTALIALFESYWDRAVPIRIDASPAGEQLTADERRLLSLLVGGVGDKSVATLLGVSHRTVQRRVQDLMHRTGARTRMQLAWQVGRLGWLDDGAGRPSSGDERDDRRAPWYRAESA